MDVEVEVRRGKGEETTLVENARGCAFVVNCFKTGYQLFWEFFDNDNEEKEEQYSRRWGREGRERRGMLFAPELWKKLEIRDASSSRRITAGERGAALGLGKWPRCYVCGLGVAT